MANFPVASPSAAGSTEASVIVKKARIFRSKSQGQISSINFSFVAISVRFKKSNEHKEKKRKKKKKPTSCYILFFSKYAIKILVLWMSFKIVYLQYSYNTIMKCTVFWLIESQSKEFSFFIFSFLASWVY